MDRQTDKQTNKQRGRQTDKHIDRQMDRLMVGQTNRHKGWRTDIETNCLYLKIFK